MWKVVIQNGKTLRFLNETGNWVPTVAQARNFQRIHLAVAHCLSNGLEKAHVLVGMLNKDGEFDSASRTILYEPRPRRSGRTPEAARAMRGLPVTLPPPQLKPKTVSSAA